MTAQIISLVEFSKSQDKGNIQETPVPLENVLALENLTRVENGVFTAELEADLKTLAKTALRITYKTEASVHRNRKHQCKGVFAPEFQDFRSFLAHVGICPHPGWSLDRIDNNNPSYFPGGVRWASPKTQGRNRSTTIMLEVDGEVRPLIEWAEITEQDPSILRKRHARGWSPREVVYGRNKTPSRTTVAERQWRALLPERAWPHLEWFENHAKVNGNYLPPHFVGARADFIQEFSAGPLGRALRLYTTAGSYVADLGAKLGDAHAYAEHYGGDPPDPRLDKEYEFWAAARSHARAVLCGQP